MRSTTWQPAAGFGWDATVADGPDPRPVPGSEHGDMGPVSGSERSDMGVRPGSEKGPAGAGEAVALVVEQLRRDVPGGIGTYCSGLVQGLVALRQAGRQVPEVTLVASRHATCPDPLLLLGLPVHAIPVPGPLLTRAWGAGLGRLGDLHDLGSGDGPGRRWAALHRAHHGHRGGGPALGSDAAPGETGHGGCGVVHATSLAVPPPGRHALVVCVHDLAWRQVPEAYPRHGRRWHQAAFDRARRRAARLVVPSSAVADELVRDGVPAAQVAVIGHGSDHLPEPDDEAAAKLLDRLGVSGPFVLSVGTLEPRKNVRRLVAAHRVAAARMGGGRSGWVLPLVVVGPSGWGAADPFGGADVHGDTADVAAGSGAAGHRVSGGLGEAPVLAAGKVPGEVLAALYRRARLLAYVPLVEGYGLPPVEAMRAGLPVVASPLPSSRGACLQVDPTDVGAIADAIVIAATDEQVRGQLVEAGRQRAARRWQDSAADHVALWQDLQ